MDAVAGAVQRGGRMTNKRAIELLQQIRDYLPHLSDEDEALTLAIDTLCRLKDRTIDEVFEELANWEISAEIKAGWSESNRERCNLILRDMQGHKEAQIEGLKRQVSECVGIAYDKGYRDGLTVGREQGYGRGWHRKEIADLGEETTESTAAAEALAEIQASAHNFFGFMEETIAKWKGEQE